MEQAPAADGLGAEEEDRAQLSSLDGKPPDSTDFAQYFCTYAYLYHQKDMLEDHKRTGAYYQAMMQNRRQFCDKVVLDVGTGSGILAVFAARAGARKVYAVEATSVAKQARRLVAANGLADTIEVIQGTVETVELPEKVDVIVSEWMGYFLLRESMLDSVLVARDRFLKPGGALYPSHAKLFLAPMRTQHTYQRQQDFQGAMAGWQAFLSEMDQYYGVDMACLTESFRKEQSQYYLQTSAWSDVHPSQMLGPPFPFRTYDLLTVTLEELAAPLQAPLSLDVIDGGPVSGLVGFFLVQFRGSPENPTDTEVTLSTAPDPTGATHWGQQTFCLSPPLECCPKDRLEGDITVVRRKDNHRLMSVAVRLAVRSGATGALEPAELRTYNIE